MNVYAHPERLRDEGEGMKASLLGGAPAESKDATSGGEA
jgi:hypothetical protein